MGYITLANGIEIFSISQEIETVSQNFFKFLLNISPGYYAIVFFVFIASMLIYSVLYVKAHLKVMGSGQR